MSKPKYAVLLCDDDRLILATLSSALRSAGLEVIEADNGDDAILLARQHRPDLAMLDMRMNGKSGLDVAAYLRDYVGTPFVFLSAFGDDQSIRQAKAFGAIEYLIKPIDARRVVDVVMRTLDRLAGVSAVHEGGELQIRSPQPPPQPAAHPDSPTEPSGWSRELAVAVGILMERQALSRDTALARLMSLSRASGQVIDVVAADLVDRLDRINLTKGEATPPLATSSTSTERSGETKA